MSLENKLNLGKRTLLKIGSILAIGAMAASFAAGCKAQPININKEVNNTTPTTQTYQTEANQKISQTTEKSLENIFESDEKNDYIKKVDRSNVYFIAASGVKGEIDEYSADALSANSTAYSLLFLSEKLEIPENNVFSVVSGDNLTVWPHYSMPEDDEYANKNVNDITKRRPDIVGNITLDELIKNIDNLFDEKNDYSESLALFYIMGHRDPGSVGKEAKISFFDETLGNKELQKVIDSIQTKYKVISIESCLPDYNLEGDENTYIIFSAPPSMVSTKSPTHIFSYTKAAYPEMNIFDAYLRGQKEKSMLNQYVLTWRDSKPILFDEGLKIFNFEKTGNKVLVEYPTLIDAEKELYDTISFETDELERVYTGDKICGLPDF